MTEEKKSAVEELKRQVFGDENANDGTDDLDEALAGMERGNYTVHDIPSATDYINVVTEARKMEMRRENERRDEENRAISSVVNWICSCIAEQIKKVIQEITQNGTQAIPPVLAKHTVQIKNGNIEIEGRRLCGMDRLDEVMNRVQSNLDGYHMEVNDLGRRLGEGLVLITVSRIDT